MGCNESVYEAIGFGSQLFSGQDGLDDFIYCSIGNRRAIEIKARTLIDGDALEPRLELPSSPFQLDRRAKYETVGG